MSVNLLFKIAAVGILVSVLGQVLKHSGREEQAYLASLAGLVLVLFWVLPYISQLFESIKELFALPVCLFFSVQWKNLGIYQKACSSCKATQT